jgi:hypothetical protein
MTMSSNDVYDRIKSSVTVQLLSVGNPRIENNFAVSGSTALSRPHYDSASRVPIKLTIRERAR